MATKCKHGATLPSRRLRDDDDDDDDDSINSVVIPGHAPFAADVRHGKAYCSEHSITTINEKNKLSQQQRVQAIEPRNHERYKRTAHEPQIS